jgi:aspartate aminotransferase
MVNLCEGKTRFIKTSPENDFKITVKEFEKHITAKAKVLILNSPSNPVGCVYNEDELKEIAKICVAKKIFVVSDEIYEKIIFDGARHVSIAGFKDDIYNLTITINGLSKSHSMTGWRLGYLGAPLDIAAAISNLQDHSTSNPSSITQKAAVAAFSSDDFAKNISREFQKRRDYIIDRLKRIDKLTYIKPRGAFYIFCGIAKTKLDSLAFTDRLLSEAKVAVVPGLAFGRDDYIRISFATSIEQLEKGLNRIEEWLRG